MFTFMSADTERYLSEKVGETANETCLLTVCASKSMIVCECEGVMRSRAKSSLRSLSHCPHLVRFKRTRVRFLR